MNRDPQLEIHLPDEERFFTFLNLPRCICGFEASLQRRTSNRLGAEYRVVCAWDSRLKEKSISCHSEATPWLPSSNLAIRHWKLVAVLSRV